MQWNPEIAEVVLAFDVRHSPGHDVDHDVDQCHQMSDVYHSSGVPWYCRVLQN